MFIEIPEAVFDIPKQILDIALRRKYWIIIPFPIVLAAGFIFIKITPRIYQAQTLIVVQKQEVPDKYVESTIAEAVGARLKSISQEVMSRTNLEKIVKEYKLYNEHEKLNIDDKVDLLRENINIKLNKVGKGVGSFSITFENRNRKKVAEIANNISSSFIEKNLKMREAHALGTSFFLADELESAKNRLNEKEEQMKNYRTKYMGAMPEQLTTNLKIIERLQIQVEQSYNNLRDAKTRERSIEKAINDTEVNTHSNQLDQASNISSLKKSLAQLETKYTKKHPDVRSMKKRIARLEEEKPEPIPETDKEHSQDARVKSSLHSVKMEVKFFQDEINKIKSQIENYQHRVNETPKRQQELLMLNRDYKNLLALYDSLLKRKLDADIAVNMERKQKGEHFRVVDPAKEPTKPIRPNVHMIAIGTVAFGLILGVGLAFVRDILDTSFKWPDEVETFLEVPVLISMPIVKR